jgi:hypothetical protein
MPSASKHAGLGGKHGDNLLKGSDIPGKIEEIKIVCTGVRTSPPGFKSPFIMAIEPIYRKSEWAINQINTQALVSLINDDYEKWIGYEIVLSKYMTTNPSTKEATWGLIVTGATKLKRKVERSEPISEVPF